MSARQWGVSPLVLSVEVHVTEGAVRTGADRSETVAIENGRDPACEGALARVVDRPVEVRVVIAEDQHLIRVFEPGQVALADGGDRTEAERRKVCLLDHLTERVSADADAERAAALDPEDAVATIGGERGDVVSWTEIVRRRPLTLGIGHQPGVIDGRGDHDHVLVTVAHRRSEIARRSWVARGATGPNRRRGRGGGRRRGRGCGRGRRSSTIGDAAVRGDSLHLRVAGGEGDSDEKGEGTEGAEVGSSLHDGITSYAFATASPVSGYGSVASGTATTTTASFPWTRVAFSPSESL